MSYSRSPRRCSLHHSFFVPGVPAPQGSKNAYRRGNRCVLVESSKKVKPWRQAVARAAKENIPQPLEGEIHLRVVFVMPRTKAMGDKPAPPMLQRPDLDKLDRSTCDGLTGAAYADDSQVTRICSEKRRAEPGEPTGAHITLSTPTNN